MFQLEGRLPVHSSATSVVWYALEVGDGRSVALKAMKNKDEFDREVHCATVLLLVFF